jgi:hypothetical protein
MGGLVENPYTIPPNIPESTRGNPFRTFTGIKGIKGIKRKLLPEACTPAEVLPQRRRGAELLRNSQEGIWNS